MPQIETLSNGPNGVRGLERKNDMSSLHGSILATSFHVYRIFHKPRSVTSAAGGKQPLFRRQPRKRISSVYPAFNMHLTMIQIPKALHYLVVENQIHKHNGGCERRCRTAGSRW